MFSVDIAQSEHFSHSRFQIALIVQRISYITNTFFLNYCLSISQLSTRFIIALVSFRIANGFWVYWKVHTEDLMCLWSQQRVRAVYIRHDYNNWPQIRKSIIFRYDIGYLDFVWFSGLFSLCYYMINDKKQQPFLHCKACFIVIFNVLSTYNNQQRNFSDAV